MGNKLQELFEKVKELFINDPETKEKWNDLVKIESFPDFLKSFKLLFWLAKRVVYVVEYVQSELGEIDKDERIELAVLLLDDLIQFKGWATIFEPFDNLVYKLLISAAVSAMDDVFGSGSWHEVDAAGVRLDPKGTLLAGLTKPSGANTN